MNKKMGNPNIRDLPKTGPKTKAGKLKNAMHGTKYFSNPNPNSMAAKAVGFDGSKESLQAYYHFVSFVLNQPIKTLSEIERLEGLLGVMEANLNNAVKRLEEGEELSDKDRKNMYLMKDTMVELHKLKYGEKKVNVNLSYDDIREQMFDK